MYRTTCHRTPGAIACLVALASLGIVACRRPEAELTADDLRRLADLPGISKSADDRLKSELARIRKEEATPRQLNRVDAARLPDGLHPTPDTRERSTKALTEWLTDGMVRQYQAKLARWYRDVLAGIPIDDRPVVKTLLKESREFRGNARKLIGQRDFGLAVAIDRGPFADMRFLDRAELFVQLESIDALSRLLDDEPVNAVVRWDLAGRMIEEIASLPHGVPRAAAARLRSNWLRVGQTIAERSASAPDVLDSIEATLNRHLQRWPEDRLALIGDRAVGLITYELLRTGYWMSLLPITELQKLKQDNRLGKMAVYLQERVDDDEWYYLRTMRKLIDVSGKPYYERRATIEAIDKAQDELRGTVDFPWYATDYLLQDVDQLQRLQALDRTLTEGLLFAIATAKDPQAPGRPPRIQETGDAVRYRIDEKNVVLENLEWPEDRTPVTVPIVTHRPR